MSTSTDLSLLINGYQRHGRRQATEHNLLALEHDMARCQVSKHWMVKTCENTPWWTSWQRISPKKKLSFALRSIDPSVWFQNNFSAQRKSLLPPSFIETRWTLSKSTVRLEVAGCCPLQTKNATKCLFAGFCWSINGWLLQNTHLVILGPFASFPC